MAENIFVCKHLKGAGYCTLYEDYCHEGPCGDSTPVEYSPVVHGRWETNNDPEETVKDFSCSVCEELLCDFDTSCGLTPGENCFYYCPNCGAKMDGGNDAENH